MRQLLLTCAIVAMMCIAGAQAWWCTGHMVVAEIARQNLDSGIESQVNAQFQFLNQWFTQTNDMVSGACWADDLKSDRLEVMAGWHFINQPYNPDNVPIHPYPIQKVNVETNIDKLSETLKKQQDNDWIVAFATANLVHFYGDIHQPLHAAELFDSLHPNGDEGGNVDSNVTWQGKVWKLHFIWDSVCAQYSAELPRPLSNSDYQYVKTLADQFQANFTVPDSQKKVWNSTVMALESLDAAIKYAYANHEIVPNQELSQQYMDTCKQVAGLRIATAGYRLAQDLNYLFKYGVSGHAAMRRLGEAKKDYKHAIREQVPRHVRHN